MGDGRLDRESIGEDPSNPLAGSLDHYQDPARTPLSFAVLAIENRRRCEAPAPEGFGHSVYGWTETDWGCAMGGESGETLSLLKKRRRGESIPAMRVGREIADVVIYADLLAQRMGLDLGELVRLKFNEISEQIGSSVRV